MDLAKSLVYALYLRCAGGLAHFDVWFGLLSRCTKSLHTFCVTSVPNRPANHAWHRSICSSVGRAKRLANICVTRHKTDCVLNVAGKQAPQASYFGRSWPFVGMQEARRSRSVFGSNGGAANAWRACILISASKHRRGIMPACFRVPRTSRSLVICPVSLGTGRTASAFMSVSC